MVLCIPGQGSPEWATAIAAGAKWWGPAVLEAGGARPSCWENREQEPTTSTRIKHLLGANCLSYTPMSRA